LGLAAVVLVVPLAEEVLFRGLVLPSIVPWFGPAAAIGVSAVLFAAVHGALWMLLPLTLLGTSLGLVALHAGSLTPAWIGHGLFNAVAFVELCRSHDVDSTRLESWASPPAVWAPSSVLLLVLLAWVVPRCGKMAVGSDATAARSLT
jgi:membrane protease YdiL (CAAX protease family)